MCNASRYDHNVTLTDRLFDALGVVFVAKAKLRFTMGDTKDFVGCCLWIESQ